MDMVINYDVPQRVDDYIHRVGRTARAGRSGRSLTFVTQHDVLMVQRIEKQTGVRMEAMKEVNEQAALKLLKPVMTATRVAHLRLKNTGFEEAVDKVKARKKESKARAKAWLEDAEGEDGTGDTGTGVSRAAATFAPAAAAAAAAAATVAGAAPTTVPPAQGVEHRSTKASKSPSGPRHSRDPHRRSRAGKTPKS